MENSIQPIPEQNISNLSDKVQEYFRTIDALITAFQTKPSHGTEIELWSNVYDAINKELKKKMKAELSHRSYKGYTFKKRMKRKRYTRKTALEAFEF